MAGFGVFVTGIGVYFAWYFWYSVVEYFTIMYLMDEAVARILIKPTMTREGRTKLLLLEMAIIAVIGIMLCVYHHFPLCCILRIWCCLDETKDVWQQMCRRYWEDFLEFDSCKPRQLFAPPMQTLIPTSPTPDLMMKNGVISKESVVPSHNQPPRHVSFAHPLESLQKAMASFRKPRDQPPGLINKTRQNLCSINVVLQMLASTPLLSESLVRETPRIKDMGMVRDFVTELAGLLSDLRRSNQATLSSQHLLELANKLHSPQPQTDSVEWLQWVLELVHVAFLPPGTTEIELNMQRYKLLRAVPLAQPLLMLYKHNQVPRALASMKAECLDKIDHAYGMQVNSYADPIQRLTEVEWLSHKLANPSIIDEMFTGQVVDTQHCKECHHMSVSVQPFKVLPVSIPTRPYGFSFYRDLTLQDCLSQFASTERLCGSNALHCKHCQTQRSSHHSFPVEPVLKMSGLRKTTLDSGVGCDSSFFHRATSSESGFLSPIRPHPEDMENSVFHRKSSTPTDRPSQMGSHSPWAGNTASPVFTMPQATSSPVQQQHQQRQQQQQQQQRAQRSFHRSEGERQALISQLPDNLVLQIIRTTYKEGQPLKIQTPITIPLVNLDMSPLSSESCLGGDHKASSNGCYKYNLYAMIIHLGENSVTQGHYVTYSQTNHGRWYCFDDEKVHPVNMDYEIMTKKLRENACLLCYRKIVC